MQPDNQDNLTPDSTIILERSHLPTDSNVSDAGSFSTMYSPISGHNLTPSKVNLHSQ